MTRDEWRRRKGRSSSFIRRSLRYAIYARDGFDCVYCRRVFPLAYDGRGLTLDHVIPRSKGGSDRPENLITACARCNAQRAARPLHATLFRDNEGVRFVPDQTRLRARVRRQLNKPINREIGRLLARLSRW